MTAARVALVTEQTVIVEVGDEERCIAWWQLREAAYQRDPLLREVYRDLLEAARTRADTAGLRRWRVEAEGLYAAPLLPTYDAAAAELPAWRCLWERQEAAGEGHDLAPGIVAETVAVVAFDPDQVAETYEYYPAT